LISRRALARGLLLLLVSLTASLVMLLLAEAMVRVILPEIGFQDTQLSLFREHAFGESVGWRPNATGVSFGVNVEIDGSGFRRMPGPTTFDTSWLFLGDSAVFGVGIDIDQTFVARLQSRHPSVKIWNSAVVGYSIQNYRDVARHFFNTDSTVKKVLLYFALNDWQPALNVMPIETTVSGRLLSALRRHSKLFRVLKGTLSDRSQLHFLHDYETFRAHAPELQDALAVVEELNREATSLGIDFLVVLLPYEYQLRKPTRENLLPQRLLARYFDTHGIRYLDAFEYFKSSAVDSKQLYLFADPMHLSAEGHTFVVELLEKNAFGGDRGRVGVHAPAN